MSFSACIGARFGLFWQLDSTLAKAILDAGPASPSTVRSCRPAPRAAAAASPWPDRRHRRAGCPARGCAGADAADGRRRDLDAVPPRRFLGLEFALPAVRPCPGQGGRPAGFTGGARLPDLPAHAPDRGLPGASRGRGRRPTCLSPSSARPRSGRPSNPARAVVGAAARATTDRLIRSHEIAGPGRRDRVESSAGPIELASKGKFP